MINESVVKEVEKVPVSDISISRRIDDMSDDILSHAAKRQLNEK